MKQLKTPLFIISSLAFVLHQVIQYGLKISVPLVDNYLDNLLAMPIILSLLVAERQFVFKKGENYRLSLLEIIVATIYISLISEFLFPFLSDRFIYDSGDFAVFFLGAMIFWVLQPKGIAKLLPPENT